MSHVIAQPTKMRSMKRVVFASFIGTTIEYYDFFIYATAAALVFPKLFFPELGTALGVAASFATFGVAFIARPLGGLIFGQLGDRVGRKASLVTTLVLMGVTTACIGLIPSGAAIGISAPILLIILRFGQGLAVGGEWASAALFVTEYAPKQHRARFSLGPTLGTSVGSLLSTLTFLVIGWTMSEQDFLSWGWRLPFLFSIVLVVIGLVVRIGLEETPVFLAAQRAHVTLEKSKTPIGDLLRTQWRVVLLAAGAPVMWLCFFYMGAVYLTNYATSSIGVSRNDVLVINLLGIAALLIFSVVGAMISDKFGRRRIMMIAGTTAAFWAFALWPLVSTGQLPLIGIAAVVTMALVGLACGPTTALVPESFATRHRSTGSGVSFNLGSIIGGAIPPIIAAPLLAAFGAIALSIMMALIALISVVCAFGLTETGGRALDDDIPAVRPDATAT